MTRSLILHTASAKEQFDVFQDNKSEEKKLLATRLALNYLKVNRWDESSPDYIEVYQTAWVEKMLLVKTAYGVAEIADIARQLKKGQDRLLVDVGIIVSRTGQILKNQEVIIEQNGTILAIVQENLGVSYEILGNVKDIKASVEDMQNNGVRIKRNNYKGSPNYTTYIIIGVIALIVIVYVKKRFGKKKGGK